MTSRIAMIWLCLWSLAGCQNSAEPIKVGMAVTMTGGGSSSWGIGARNAAMLAISEVNNSGGIKGRPLELLVKDDKGTVDGALEADQALIDEGVVAILGHYVSTLALAASPLLTEHNITMIPLAAVTPALSGKDDNIVRVPVPADKNAVVLAEYIVEETDVRTMAIVYDMSNPAYSQAWHDKFKAAFEALGGQVTLSLPFDPKKRFSAPELSEQILAAKTDGLLLVANAVNAALICQHIRNANDDIAFFASRWSTSDPTFITNGGGAVEGVTSVIDTNFAFEGQTYLTFRDKFYEQYNMEVNASSQWAYEAATMLIKALHSTTDPSKIKQALLNQRVFPGLTGEIVLDNYGDPSRPMWINRIEGGEVVTVKPVQQR